MRYDKCFSVAIVLCTLVFFMIGSAPVASARPTPVTIDCLFDPSTFPDEAGTFTTSGALNISGYATMHIECNDKGTRCDCTVILIPTDGTGTINIRQECEFITPYPYHGKWQIIGGTGAYATLRGHGSLTMPDPANSEDMTGTIR